MSKEFPMDVMKDVMKEHCIGCNYAYYTHMGYQS